MSLLLFDPWHIVPQWLPGSPSSSLVWGRVLNILTTSPLHMTVLFCHWFSCLWSHNSALSIFLLTWWFYNLCTCQDIFSWFLHPSSYFQSLDATLFLWLVASGVSGSVPVILPWRFFPHAGPGLLICLTEQPFPCLSLTISSSLRKVGQVLQRSGSLCSFCFLKEDVVSTWRSNCLDR